MSVSQQPDVSGNDDEKIAGNEELDLIAEL
jgi:hypothetical protein